MKNFSPKFKVDLILIGILALVILSGCNQNREGLLKKFAAPEDETIATNYIALLRQNKFEPIVKDIDPSLKSVLTQDLLVKMAAAIPTQDPISVKIVGAQQFHNSGLHQVNLSFEYQFPTNWLVINVATQKKGGISTIIGLHIYPLSESLENLNQFTLTGKTFPQHVTLALAILIPCFTLYALVLCIRTKIEKKKWLWIIFILFGIGKFTVNWTTNQWGFIPLNFLLLGSSSFAPPFGAWLISVSLPLGAIVFLLRRKKFAAQIAPANPVP